MSIFGKWPHREKNFLDDGESVWIFGAGKFGRLVANVCLAQGIKVNGFIQTSPTSSNLLGVPIITWNDLSKRDRIIPLIIGIFNRDSPLDELVTIAKNSGFERIILPWDIAEQFGSKLGWNYWLAGSNFLRSYSKDLNWLYERLQDDASRNCLERVVNFRLGLDLNYASFRHKSKQYFNELTIPKLKGKELDFLDGGAFNGDNLKQLSKITKIHQAWLFEPDIQNFKNMVAKVNRAKLPGYCLPLGLSNCNKNIKFFGGSGEDAHIDLNGNNHITTVSIDDFLSGQKVDLVKLDVEGSEIPALEGAIKTISNFKPILALSCYHHPTDLWILPRLIDKICKAYNFYFLQHCNNSFDLVLYGIPSE